MKKQLIIGCLVFCIGPAFVVAKARTTLQLVFYQNGTSCEFAFADSCPDIGVPNCVQELFEDENGSISLGFSKQIFATASNMQTCIGPYHHD